MNKLIIQIHCCPIKILLRCKNRADPANEVSPIFVRFLSPNQINPTMGKSIYFSGQPLYCQVVKLLDKQKNFQRQTVNMAVSSM